MVASASAATISVTQGSVSVNTGNGFRPVTGSATINPGDRIMIPPNGQATVVFNDGCSVQLSTAQTLIVPQASPCATAGQNNPLANAGGWIVGGAVVGGGILLATQLNNKDDKPASP